MAQTSLNIRMDEELKQQFDEFCTDMGMSMTTAINIYAKKVVREYRIPFDIGAKIPNAETLAAMAEVEEMKKNGTGKKYSSVAELFEDLDNDL